MAEKPSVGKELARVLDCRQSRNGHMVGNKYIVTWSLGHLVTLADPEVYGEQYKNWNLESLPMLPKKMELVVIKETSKQYGVVKSLLRSPEVDSLVIATDAGREGELVARWIIAKAGFRKPVKRLWISSQTDNAIREGFKNLKPAQEYENLYKAASCRAEADWLVGLNVTRALTCKFNAQLSAGRVQTPTLSIIIDREQEIRKFIPKDYYCVTAYSSKMHFTWKDKKTKQVRIFDKAKAEEIMAKIKGQNAVITHVNKEYKRQQPPLLYDLTQLQIDANKRYGFSAKKTLGLMQNLYERHKLLTYPRTDSKYLTQDIVSTLGIRLKAIMTGPYAQKVRELMKTPLRVTKRMVDDSKVSDHHAIIPTEEPLNLSDLTSEEKYIYNLVVTRFLEALSPDYEYEQLSVSANIKGELFTAQGKTVKNPGWKSVANSSEDEDISDSDERSQIIPQVNQGESHIINKVNLVNGKTKPPARYTEATLLTAMEHPGKFVQDANIREALDNANGLGTPATRAEIIERLFSANYCDRRGKEIFPTSKGMQLIELVPPDLKSAELTGKWENQLTAISKGKASAFDFDRNIRTYASSIVGQVIASNATYRHDNLTKNRCPNCDKFMLEIKGKHGISLVCQDRECGYRENLSKTSNARCPNCHKNLELYGEGEGRKYICKCGFKEKFETFNKRLEENKKSMNKRETAEYLRKQQNEKPATTAFEDAFSKLKL